MFRSSLRATNFQLTMRSFSISAQSSHELQEIHEIKEIKESKESKEIKETVQATKILDAPIEKEILVKLSAFSARSGLYFKNQSTILDAVTHSSFIKKNNNSARYNCFGGKILAMYVTEYVMAQYPLIPAEVVTSITESYIGPLSLASLGKNLGLQYIMRWKITESDKASIGPASVRAYAMKSLVGALFIEHGPSATKVFIKQNILGRAIDLHAHLDLYAKLRRPRALLASLSKSLGKPVPIARLIKETGRHSSSPIFVVGIYSGFEKIGESFGSSLSMAETRAIKDALTRHYSAEVKVTELSSDNESDESISFFDIK